MNLRLVKGFPHPYRPVYKIWVRHQMEFQTNQLEFRQEMSLFQTCRNPRRLPKITDKLMTVFL